MATSDLFEKIREILVAQLAVKPELVKPESTLNDDLGSDSLDAAEIIIALEEKFGVKISDDEAIKITTVSEIIELVSKKLPENATDQS